MMNKKNLPHIVTVVSFAVFIVLGLACATAPSEGGSTTASTLPDGYCTFTIENISPRHSITQITVSGGNETNRFSQTYQVRLQPKGSGMLAMGGSKDIGEIVGDYRFPVLPIGVYDITLLWSDGGETKHTQNVRGGTSYYNH